MDHVFVASKFCGIDYIDFIIVDIAIEKSSRIKTII